MQLTNVAPVATPVPVNVAAATPVPAQAAVPGPVEDSQPGLGAKLLGEVSGLRSRASGAQQRALESQQLLGAISAGLGERFSMIARSVWSALRGSEAPTTPTAPTEPTDPPAAA